MQNEQIELESGALVSVRFERGEGMSLAICAGESDSGTEITCSPADVDRIFALLVVGRRGSWGYS